MRSHIARVYNIACHANSALQDLVNGLNAQMGANTYSFINDGATIQTNGTDAIRCAIIYKAVFKKKVQYENKLYTFLFGYGSLLYLLSPGN